MQKLSNVTFDLSKMLPGRATTTAALFFMLVSSVALLQSAVSQATQQFVGNVTDASHAVIAGAVVTVHNEDTGEDVIVKTTKAGDYTVPYLKTGFYSVTADKTGFKTLIFTHISLDTDKTAKIDFVLPIGSVSETVTVSSASAQIELSKADRGEIIDAERVQELPTDGRNVLELFELSPGTVNTHNPQFTRPQDNVAGNLYANGNGGVLNAPVQGKSRRSDERQCGRLLGLSPSARLGRRVQGRDQSL